MKQHLIIFTIFCSIQTWVNAGEILQKPIIEGIIQPSHTIAYSSSLYEKGVLNPAGFNSIHFSIPLIKVSVIFKEEGVYHYNNQWIQREPEVIRDYERAIQCDRSFRDELRIFPAFIPISLLLNAKEGDALSLTVHGYQTQVICSAMYIGKLHDYNKEHAIQKLSQLKQFTFEQLINFRLTRFTPKYMVYKNQKANEREALERGLLIKESDHLLKHGTNAAHTKEKIVAKMILQQPWINVVMLLWPFRHETG